MMSASNHPAGRRAPTPAVGADGATPAQAARRRGHACIADLLEHAAEGADSI